MGVMSTFLRAIRAGAVNIRHGAVLLAHYGRFGTTFDECSKIMVEVLREEGMYNGNPDIVVSVVTQAIREVRLLVVIRCQSLSQQFLLQVVYSCVGRCR